MSEAKHSPGFADLHFEPHGGYGMIVDGEAMPFGYISEQGYGKPVFELTPIFEHDADKLRCLAMKMAAAPDLLVMLKVAQLWLDVDGRYDMQGINAAIAKAEGCSPSPHASATEEGE